MSGDADRRDRNESRRIAIVLVSLVAALGVAVVLMLPMLGGIVDAHLAPGLGLKNAAVIAFFVTIVVLAGFALVAGDGLLGELQFILAGFFLFFVIIWLLLAWIF